MLFGIIIQKELKKLIISIQTRLNSNRMRNISPDDMFDCNVDNKDFV